MRREEVWHAARAACRVLGVRRVLIIGSQAAWGSLDVKDLPRDATLSAEADVRAIDIIGDPAESAMKLGAIGLGSQFEETYGYYVDGVEPGTAALPEGWEQRLVEHTVGEDQHGPLLAYFPEIHDPCRWSPQGPSVRPRPRGGRPCPSPAPDRGNRRHVQVAAG